MRDFLMNPANDISTVEKLEQLAVAFEDSRKASRDIKDVGKEAAKPYSINVVGKGVPVCGSCGKQHGKGRCVAKDVECWICTETGHFARLCKTRKAKNKQNQVAESDDDNDDHEKVNYLNGVHPGDFGVLSVTSGQDDEHPPAYIRVKVNDNRLKLLLDTGAGVTVVSKSVWTQIGKPKLASCANLRSYNGVINTLGKCLIEVKLGKVRRKLWAWLYQ
uniref:Peptidase A2 domain-containing protein n=1 Tax=Panagrolaimus sp. ES5 TaxID=591445 RepID=A0AC34GHG4_9BILA